MESKNEAKKASPFGRGGGVADGEGGEDLGRETPFHGERGLSPKPTLYQSRSHRAPSIMSTDFDLHHGRSAVGTSFLGGYFLFGRLTYRFLHQKTNFLGREIRVAGTCGAAWNSSFVLRKLLSSHHDVIIPREVTLIGRGFRVAGTCGAAWNSLFVPRKLSSSCHDFLIPRKSHSFRQRN